MLIDYVHIRHVWRSQRLFVVGITLHITISKWILSSHHGFWELGPVWLPHIAIDGTSKVLWLEWVLHAPQGFSLHNHDEGVFGSVDDDFWGQSWGVSDLFQVPTTTVHPFKLSVEDVVSLDGLERRIPFHPQHGGVVLSLYTVDGYIRWHYCLCVDKIMIA